MRKKNTILLASYASVIMKLQLKTRSIQLVIKQLTCQNHAIMASKTAAHKRNVATLCRHIETADDLPK
jgi:hypothetical protein